MRLLPPRCAIVLPALVVLGLAGPACAGASQVGMASIYAHRLDGRTTASGDDYDPQALTAAHRELPIGTRVRVTNLRNHRSVVVRINDRGPGVRRHLIDLTPRAATAIGMRRHGVARVRLDVLSEPAAGTAARQPATAGASGITSGAREAAGGNSGAREAAAGTSGAGEAVGGESGAGGAAGHAGLAGAPAGNPAAKARTQ